MYSLLYISFTLLIYININTSILNKLFVYSNHETEDGYHVP